MTSELPRGMRCPWITAKKDTDKLPAIVRAVSEVFNIAPQDIWLARRLAVIDARNVVYHVAKLTTRLTSGDIAKMFCRDQSTVLAAQRHVARERTRDPELDAKVRRVMDII